MVCQEDEIMEEYEVRATQETVSEDEDDHSVAEQEPSQTEDSAPNAEEQLAARVLKETQSEVLPCPEAPD